MPHDAADDNDVLNRLYAAVDDHCLPWLDDLAVAAGLRHRCSNCDAVLDLDYRCDPCDSTPAEQAITAVLACHADTAIVRFIDQEHRYLVARTTSGAGIYLIRDARGGVADFTEDAYEECVREGEAAGLAPVYHVHSRYNLFETSGVHWTQTPGVPGAAALPAFVVAQHNPSWFTINEDAFTRWVTENAEDVSVRIPTRDGDAPASDLLALVDSAMAAQVLTGDSRLELLITPDNTRPIGFTLMLRNRTGRQENIAVTTGFTEIFDADSGLSTSDAARHYLGHIAEVANGILYESGAPLDQDAAEHTSVRAHAAPTVPGETPPTSTAEMSL